MKWKDIMCGAGQFLKRMENIICLLLGGLRKLILRGAI